jgi:hypothetical protein
MPIADALIEPSDPPKLFCAECKSEVDPAAVRCAICGNPLDVPDAMIATNTILPAVPEKPKTDYMLSAEIFSVVLIAGFALFEFFLRTGMIASKNQGHGWGLAMVVYLVALLVILWAVFSEKP